MLFVIAALLAVLAAGCAPSMAGSPSNTTPAPSETRSPAVTPVAETSPAATPTAVPAGGLAQDVASRAAEWLAGEVNVSVDDFRLVEAEQVEWTDSCFGLGGPAESCLAAITPGWRIAFEADGHQYEVRTDTSGSNFRLAPQAS
jgi:hypothetical protein